MELSGAAEPLRGAVQFPSKCAVTPLPGGGPPRYQLCRPTGPVMTTLVTFPLDLGAALLPADPEDRQLISAHPDVMQRRQVQTRVIGVQPGKDKVE